MIRQLGAVACILLSAFPALAADDDLLLRKDDRVVFYGDSITQQRLYTRYVQQYVYVRHPELNVRFFNAGWGGDTAKGANARLERDVLHLDPTVVTLCFGMNDGRYRAQDDSIAEGYEREMDALVARLVDANIRVLVASPGCVDSDRRPQLAAVKYNDVLRQLGRAAERVAEKHGCRFVDLHTAMLRVQTEQKEQDPDFTMIPDAVHPAPPGHLVMALEILRGLGVDAMAPLGTFTSEGSTFATTVDLATPFWIDDGGTRVARACGLVDDLVAQKLTIEGLMKGEYDVAIAGQSLGTFSAAELARGVRVAGSWSASGRAVHDRIVDLENRYFEAWRNERVPSLAKARDGRIAELERAIASSRMETLALRHDLVIAMASGRSSRKLTAELLPSGPNLAHGKDYESSDPNPHGWGDGGLTDGSWIADAQDCFATGSAPAFPKHVTVDLGRTQKIAVVRLGVPEFGSTKTVRVAVSKSGKTYRDVASHVFGQSAAERRTLRFDATPARYVRLIYVDHHATTVGYPATFAFTTELEVYGP